MGMRPVQKEQMMLESVAVAAAGRRGRPRLGRRRQRERLALVHWPLPNTKFGPRAICGGWASSGWVRGRVALL